MYKYEPLPRHLVEGSTLMKENNDCTVKAFAIALNTTYEKAHRHLAVFCDRPPRKGIISRRKLIPSLFKTKNKEGPYSPTDKVSLKTFCQRHPVGRYYVCVRGHAIGVVDGVVYDHSDKPRRMVTWALRIYPNEVLYSDTQNGSH